MSSRLFRCFAGLLILGSLSLQSACAEEAEAAESEKPAAQRRAELLVEKLNERIKFLPDDANARYSRGCYNFYAGNFEASVADFDRYVELDPEAERRLWERGISHYYAGKYQAGADQFALYQTYHDSDVENAVWRYLCQMKVDGEEKARADMLPIKKDHRNPLMTIYALFKNEATPQDVLDQAEKGNEHEIELEASRFYAQLYVGLYYEAHGEPEKGRKYLQQAWTDHRENGPLSAMFSGYMWNVARVHCMHTPLKKDATKKD